MSDVLKTIEPYYFDQDVGRVLGASVGVAVALVIYYLGVEAFVAGAIGFVVFSFVKLEVSRRQDKRRQAADSPQAKRALVDQVFADLSEPEKVLLKHFAAEGTCRLIWKAIPGDVGAATTILIQRGFAEFYYWDEPEPIGLEISTDMYDAAVRAHAKDLADIPF